MINQEEAHRLLAGLYPCKEPFTVAFSGKKSGSVNGIYRPAAHEIVIHNRNFTGDSGGANEPLLLYTGLHELAHHIQYTEYGQEGARPHTKLFHAILDSLAEKAEAVGIYQPAIDTDIERLASEAHKISCAIAKLQRELGACLRSLEQACADKGVRFEDVVKRKARITLETAQKACRMATLDLPEDIGADIQETIARERDGDKRKAMAVAAQAGKSPAQVKQSGSPPPSRQIESKIENLLREKERLEAKIAALQQRVKTIMRQLNTDSGLQGKGLLKTKIHDEFFALK